MAPNKKRKKPTKVVSNPARGFATTSTPSKIDKTIQEANIPESEERITRPNSVVLDEEANGSTVRDTQLIGSHHLSPEDFEQRLEESELQNLVEKHGQKARKDSSRQVARLRTDRRVLRGQAEVLNPRKWLPPELMEQVFDLAGEEMSNGVFYSETASRRALKMSEEDTTVKLWTLKQTLLGLEIPKEAVTLVLRKLLKDPSMATRASNFGTKDSLWALEESFDWLALECLNEELPDYDTSKGSIGSRLKAPSSRSELDTPNTTPSDSGIVTPNLKEPQQEGPALINRLDQEGGSEKHDHESLIISDLDSDPEPESLLSSYLSAKARLFKLLPGSVKNGPTKGRKHNPAVPTHTTEGASSGAMASHLQKKLMKIESDVLFDQHEADQLWLMRRNELSEELAARRALGLSNTQPAKAPGGVMKSEAAEEVNVGVFPSHDGSGTEDSDIILGDLFTSLPDSEVDATTGETNTKVTDSEGTTVTIRDFGRWTGMSPSRVLEEACRARSQSEAYVSTAALFLIFAFSAEEKVYLRLPSVWRDLWNDYAHAKNELDDAADRETMRALRDMVRDKLDRDEEDGVVLTSGFQKRIAAINGKDDTEHGPRENTVQNTVDQEHLKEIWIHKSSSHLYQNMLRSRQSLPMWGFKHEVLATIDRHQVVIICGETGCGKSTQVPSFILEHELSRGKPCKVYCTEPRRISAISLARRVSEELGERKGDMGTSRSLVGFAIRLESNVTNHTRLIYATTGIVMRMLERSSDLGDITHIVLDEVHERSIESDFLLIVLRKLMLRRPELKVVLMSATVDAQRFSTYLNEAPVLNVPGRTFPVETRFLEDAIELTQYSTDSEKQSSSREDDLDDADIEDSPETKSQSGTVDGLSGYSANTRKTLAQLDEYRVEYGLVIQLIEVIATTLPYTQYSKAILVFLPGIAEIRQLNDYLGCHPSFHQGWEICSLHSTIASDEQERAFVIPQPGIRKIVLATNIAETGITIPDITCVIDTGKHKEMRFDERRQLSRLIETFISRANAKQRRGRAGRVQEGLCFHLFTKMRHDSLMAEQQTPEILRLSLQDLVLRVKICNLGAIEQTLSEAMDPPSAKNIKRAIDALVDVKALTPAEDLTSLGRQLARLPLDVCLGKLILLGSIFSCLDVTLTIAAILTSKSPFSAPMGARKQADIARLAFKRDLKSQLVVSIVDAGFLVLSEGEKSSLNKARFATQQHYFFKLPEWVDINSDNDLIVNSVVAWSFYPKLLSRDGKGWRNVANNQSVSLHPTSVNKGSGASKWLSFYHIMQSSNKFYNAHETSAAEDFPIALLCGDADFRMYSGVIVIDGNRARFALLDWKSLLAIKILRTRLQDIMSRSFKNPGKPLSAQQQKWLSIWQQIFSQRREPKH
ncbi:MAG: hypothetical protein M1836_000277 [Candelina mexicana]|nr:MAG: hypothetical protein M1836_000277 [Candelina mexicana]